MGCGLGKRLNSVYQNACLCVTLNFCITRKTGSFPPGMPLGKKRSWIAESKHLCKSQPLIQEFWLLELAVFSLCTPKPPEEIRGKEPWGFGLTMPGKLEASALGVQSKECDHQVAPSPQSVASPGHMAKLRGIFCPPQRYYIW